MSEVEKKAEAYASACVDNPRDQLDTPSEMRYHAYLAGYLEATQDAVAACEKVGNEPGCDYPARRVAEEIRALAGEGK